MELLKLFYEFLKIGLVSIGGGYASIPLIQENVVNTHQWISSRTFIDVITISQMTPGPLSVNLSTFVGMEVAGIPGAIVATLGGVSVGVLLANSLYHLYLKYKHHDVVSVIMESLRVSSVALIANAAIIVMSLLLLGESGKLSNFDFKSMIVFSISIFLIKKFHLKMGPLLAVSALIGLLLSFA